MPQASIWQELPRVWAEAWRDAEEICKRYERRKAHAMKIEADGVEVYPRLHIPGKADLAEHTRLYPTHATSQETILREVLTCLATRYPLAREVKFSLLWAGTQAKVKELVTFAREQSSAV